LPWWTSQSTIATRSIPRSRCAQRAAIAMLLTRQKPIAAPRSAWWPGGRRSANALSSCPSSTCSTAVSSPPAASSMASWVPGPVHASSPTSSRSPVDVAARIRSTWASVWASRSSASVANRGATSVTWASTPLPSNARRVRVRRSGRSNGGSDSHAGWPSGGMPPGGSCATQRSS
jgi:hypothetical protein